MANKKHHLSYLICSAIINHVLSVVHNTHTESETFSTSFSLAGFSDGTVDSSETQLANQTIPADLMDSMGGIIWYML